MLLSLRAKLASLASQITDLDNLPALASLNPEQEQGSPKKMIKRAAERDISIAFFPDKSLHHPCGRINKRAHAERHEVMLTELPSCEKTSRKEKCSSLTPIILLNIHTTKQTKCIFQEPTIKKSYSVVKY